MAQYVVTYTISDDTKRKEFVEKLENVGLKIFNDQSVNYGPYDESQRKGSISNYLKTISNNLGTEDVVYLFEGDLIPVKQKTIECITIKGTAK
jgi:hypothetical protein